MYSAGMEGAAAGCLMKKVSCASRAGCCCGWKSASKFQKEDSTYCCVAISSKPISRKMSRNIARTFISGWSEPPAGGFPAASRLSGLKAWSRHVPLTSISCVRSATALTPHDPNIAPGLTLRLLTVTAAIRLRFLSIARASAGMAASWSPAASTACSCCCTASTIDATARLTTLAPSSLATSSHLFCTALARPTLAAGPAAAASLSCGMLPVAGTSANTAASGLPPLATVLPSAERRTTFFDRFAHAMKSLAARLLHTPMRLVCSKPLVSANGTVSSMTPADVSCARTASSITLLGAESAAAEGAALGFALAGAALGLAGGGVRDADCFPPLTSSSSFASS
mmetsp:Transcript_30653/g.72311  ORF Transcript_30653/g.72311 Transcript_30653/m.72311 type:complete len:341 (+) Transcript_30653:866-1888(+)